MPLREAYLLVVQLGSNPESRFTAAEMDWERPVSWEWLVLADIYDVLRASNSKRRQRPYPRPTTKRRKLGGSNKRRSVAEVRRILRPNGEKPPEN